jgi:hypothetical protein
MDIAKIEANATNAVARVAPWLSPVPTAFLIGRATLVHLTWPLPVAVVAAVVVECLGLSTINTALELREYNASRKKSDPVAPFAVALVLAGVYFATAITLTVALDTLPLLARYAPAIFPILSLCGVTTLAMRADHRRRLDAIVGERAERKAARREAQALRGLRVEQAQDIVPTPQDIAPTPYVCAECGMSFAKQQGLAAHIRHMHRNGHAKSLSDVLSANGNGHEEMSQ